MWKINITGKGAEGNRIKTFGLYALCVILFFIFSNIMIDITLKATYDPIDTYKTESHGVAIDIKEAKATYVNGYVGGKLINESEQIDKTYMKIDLYTKRDVCMGTKYITFDNLKQGEKRDFRIGFKFTDIDHAVVTMVDEIEPEVTEEQFVSDDLKGTALIAAIILLCYL